MDRDLKRFAQAVRLDVRLYVKRRQAAPPPMVWVPDDGVDPRRPVYADFREAESDLDVRRILRLVIEEKRARFAAAGGMFRSELVDGKLRSDYGLTVVSALEVIQVSTHITMDLSDRRWRAHAWEADEFDYPYVELMQGAIRAARKDVAL